MLLEFLWETWMKNTYLDFFNFAGHAILTGIVMDNDQFSSVQSLSRVQLFATPWIAARPGLPVHHQLPEFTQTRVHWVGTMTNQATPCKICLEVFLPQVTV